MPLFAFPAGDCLLGRFDTIAQSPIIALLALTARDRRNGLLVSPAPIIG